jgi:membrane protease YdiL (CAAX protease family)
MTENTVSKTPAIISIVATVILLLVVGAFVFFIDLIALNGVSESDGGVALATLGVCQSIVLILSAVLTGRFTNFLIFKRGWNNILAVSVSVITVTLIGMIFYFAAILLSVGVAEALFNN